ncbi:hypothetical protein JCM11251_003351 [Rhodosporidiobolus azoricus]
MPLLRRASDTSAKPPPSYTTSTSPPPPFTAFPDKYHVGSKLALLINTEQVKRHLKLLGAFYRLRKKVEDLEGGWTGHLDKKTKWAVFVNIAVYRLELFLDKVIKDPSLSTARVRVTPPLDVALALHSYMLNPGNFIEDAKRKTGVDELLAEAIINQISSIGDRTFEQDPLQVEKEEWIAATKTNYDPVLHFQSTEAWLTPTGVGYAQQGFKLKSKSGDTWTHETRGLYKLAKDIIDSKVNTLFPLAGTFISDLSACDHPYESRRALFVRDKILNTAVVKVATSPLELLMPLATSQSARNIMSRYTRGERFSLDLAMAVLRQGSFIDKMHSLGWLEPGRFDEDDTLLKRCVARYHAFCDLLSSTPSMFCVPTLDIDLGWHTHQLSSTYLTDMRDKVGRFVNHDDKVEEGKLSTSFDVTARAWQARFGVPYSSCGCPLPSQPPLSRLAAKLNLNTQPSYPSAALSQLHPSREDADATHASEHNSLVLPRHPDAMKKRKERRMEVQKRREKEDREWEKDRKKRQKAGRVKEEEEDWRRRRAEHDTAFFYPVPLVPVYGPIGYPVSAGGCCANDGNHVGGFASSGNPGCGSGCPGTGTCASANGSCASGGSSSSSACASCSSGSSSGCGSSSSGCSSGSSGCGGGGGGGCGGS